MAERELRRHNLENAAAALDAWCDYLRRMLALQAEARGSTAEVPALSIPTDDLQNLLKELDDVNRTIHDLLAD